MTGVRRRANPLSPVRLELKAAGGYSTVGMELVLSIVFGFVGGRWLDGKLETEPYLAIAGFFFGCVAGFRALWRAAERMRRETERDSFSENATDRTARFALDQREPGDDAPPTP